MKRHLATLAVSVALTIVAATAWAYFSAGSVPGGSGAAAASSVDPGATPAASATGSSVTVSWTATTLANGQAVSGYVVKRYDAGTLAPQTILSACTGTIAATSCVESGVPNGSWKYTITPVIGTSWQGPESPKSATVTVNNDATAPTNSLTLSSVTGGAHLAGTTLYYRGTAAGSLRITNAVADAGSGPASSATAALGGASTGWTHAPSTVSSPSGGPYVSTPFSWVAGTTSAPSEAVTGRDGAGNSAVTTLTFTNDSTAPTGSSISYADGASGQSVSITFGTGTDAGSGVATRRLQRATAPLSGGSCGSWSGFANIGADGPTSPYVDGSLAIACYKYRYVVTDRVGNQDVATSSSVVKVGYGGGIGATSGLLAHWRLGDSPTVAVTTSSDSFTDTSGKLLTAHTGELAATWSRVLGAANATVSNEGRIFKANAGYAVVPNSLVQATPDYSVEADVVDKSVISDDAMGVIGRLNASNTFYLASWEERDNSWNLALVTNGVIDYIDYVPNQPALVIGQTYRLKLEMVGSALKLYVDGVLKVSVTDTTLTAAGRAGVMTGRIGTSVAQSNTTGLHLDNFQVSTTSRALDSKGDNHGAYVNGVTRGVSGALPGDPDTAASFDGVNDYVQVLNPTGIPVGSSARSVEAWFKTTSAARQVIFDYGSLGTQQEFGLWINAGGGAMTAWGWGGGNDRSFTLASPVNNGAWHQVVITYDGTTLVLYVDGVALPSQTATRNTTIDAYGFGIGAVINPGDAGGNSGGFFNGSIDEVALYTTVLDQATVTAHYLLGGAPLGDTSGPTGGSVDASGLVGTGARHATSTTLSLVLAAGTDPSGVAASGNQLLRATASLTDGSCGTFGSYAPVADDPTSPASDAVADGACYRYQYVVSDTAGNPTTYTSPEIKVDVAALAAPALSFSTFTNSSWPGAGSTVYYRSTATSGSLRVTATAGSPSGIASYAFPALGSGWTATPGGSGVTTYSWSAANPAAPGTKTVTATSNAGTTSAAAPFTLTADNTAPTGSGLSYLNGSTTSTSVSVALTTGTDSGSGIGTRLLQRASATLASGTCGSYGAFATVTNGTNPTSPVADAVAANTCYQYRYVVTDNVGNTDTVVGTSVVKVIASYAATVASTGGLQSWWRLGEASGTSAADAQGGSAGTYTNGPTLGQAGAIAGDANTAVGFDGSNDYVAASRTATSTFSVELWFRSTQGLGTGTTWASGAGLVSADLAGTTNDYGVSLRADGKIVAGIGATSVVSSAGGYNDGGWHYVVLTRQSGNALALYVDAAATTGPTSSGALSGTASIALGRINPGSNYLQGTLDEVAVYSTAIDAATVSAHYAAGTTP